MEKNKDLKTQALLLNVSRKVRDGKTISEAYDQASSEAVQEENFQNAIPEQLTVASKKFGPKVAKNLLDQMRETNDVLDKAAMSGQKFTS